MKIDTKGLHVMACSECSYPLMNTALKGPNIVARCVQCDKFNGCVSKEDNGDRERTSKSVHSSIPERVKVLVRFRASCKCELCGKSAADSCLHIGHLISVDDGLRFGISTQVLNSEENLALLCKECNEDMGSETVPLRIAVIIIAIRSRKTLRNFQSVINSAN